ncbi:DNA-directed RNA polymerase III subunit RPC5-like [Haemaphysalis longicornis]
MASTSGVEGYVAMASTSTYGVEYNETMASTSTYGVEDDDEVVAELDVYISKALADQLYLLQFPYQSTKREYAYEQILGVRVKPKQKKVELEYALDMDDPSYDRACAEWLAEKANWEGDGLTGCTDKYGCELHLTPLHAVLQMRPSFQHLEPSGAETEEEEQEVKPTLVLMKFEEHESYREKRARERSFQFVQQKEEKEAWIEANYHGPETEMSCVERSKLFCRQMDADMSDLPGTLPQYFQSLVTDKKESSDADADKANTKKTGCTHMSAPDALNSLTLLDQIQAIFLKANVVNLAELMTMLPPQGDMLDVLRQLTKVAILVRGCWVVKSDVLYPKGTLSPRTGVPAEIICRARDYLMYLFTQWSHVSKGMFSNALKLPGDEIEALLSGMAKPMPGGWEFVLPCDTDFITKFPEVVTRQKMYWDEKKQQLSKYFQLPRQDSRGAVMQSTAAEVARARQVRRRPRSPHDSTGSEGSGSEGGSVTNGQKVTKKTPGVKCAVKLLLR